MPQLNVRQNNPSLGFASGMKIPLQKAYYEETESGKFSCAL